MNNCLYYNTPLNEYQIYYGSSCQPPFKAGKEILTQLPKNVAIIRAVATVAFTSLLALKLSVTVFFWPVVVAGIAFAGWTIYSHLLCKDPLMETFYTIVGGKDKFELLPQINLAQASHEKISEPISKIDWDGLNHGIARTKTLDGRNVIIIKGFTRHDDGMVCRTKGVLAFVEKTCPGDIGGMALDELTYSIMHAILAPHEGNTLCSSPYFNNFSGRTKLISRDCKISSSISSDMANELFFQLADIRQSR